MDTLTKYILWNNFPSKHLWKKIVKENVYEHHNVPWHDKINSHEHLTMFAEIHRDDSPWWLLANNNPDYLQQINYVFRLPSGSFQIKGNRANKPETYGDYCDICSKGYENPIEHSLLHCSGQGYQIA